MGQKSQNIGHSTSIQVKQKDNAHIDFVLEKSIFTNIFEKDIRRAYIYKKAERLGKAIHLITPAFTDSQTLKNRLDRIAIGLVDAALLPPSAARTALSKELLALSSMLSIARTGGFLSSMNADLITKEAHLLLEEVAAYEAPRLFLDSTPTLSGIAREALATHTEPTKRQIHTAPATGGKPRKGHIKDKETGAIKDRREAVLSVIQNKGKAGIKDISMVVRGVSEKTIQRELSALVEEGRVLKEGERRWSTYTLA